MDEGHLPFLALERSRRLMAEQGYSFATAREARSSAMSLPPNTPVAASNDWFPADLVENHLSHFHEELGLSREEFLGLGRIDPNHLHTAFCMTVLAPSANGVSRGIWQSLWPGFSEHEIPIDHITNGVHVHTWTALEMSDLFERHLGDT